MCCDGLQDSYQEFIGEVNDGYNPSGSDPVTGFPTGKIGLIGSVIRLMFGKDIAASGSLIPGLLGRSTFIVWVRVKNINYHRTITFDLWVVPVYEGLISFSSCTVRKEIAPLTSTELVAAAPVLMLHLLLMKLQLEWILWCYRENSDLLFK